MDAREILAAAELISYAADDPDASEWRTLDGLRFGRLTLMHKAVNLARHVLATVRPDDGEDVVVPGCASKVVGGVAMQVLWDYSQLSIVAHPVESGAGVLVELRTLVVKRPTNGDVRRLCEALGIKTKEDGS